MKPIEFTREETKVLVDQIRDHFRDEHDVDLGNIPAEMVLRFFAERIGPHFYNRGLADAQALIRDRTDRLLDDLYALEREPLARR